MRSPQPLYVDEQELVSLHDHALAEYGGSVGILYPAALESCIAQPKMAVFGQERFPTVHEKAAAYCFFIIRNHPFVDGNKRTAFLTALHFLIKNGIMPFFDEEDTYETLLRVAEAKAGLEELSLLFEGAIRQKPTSLSVDSDD